MQVELGRFPTTGFLPALIPTAVHYPSPLNKQLAVADKNAYLPVSENIANCVISLPMGPYLSYENQCIIASEIKLIIDDY